MLFDVHRSVIEDLDDIHGIWEKIEEEENKPGLRNASGCYIFSIKHGNNFKPWYVGKAEKTRFSTEVFNKRNQKMCRDILKKPGKINLFLLPKLTPTGRFARPQPSRHIQHLEVHLISWALKRNENLSNVHYATIFRELEVPGLFNDGPGQPPLEVQDLKHTLGL